VRVGRAPRALAELSGLAASRRHPGIYWAHNDSGNTFELFAIREDGTAVARYPLAGPGATDVEDVAVGPCARNAAATCVYLADIGDNGGRRRRVAVHRLAEPPLQDGLRLSTERLAFRYAEGPRNAEALVVEPGSARLFVLTRVEGSLGDLYRLDGLGPGREGVARRVARLAAGAPPDGPTTAADLHPTGARLLVRTYGGAWELRRPGATRVEALVTATPHPVPNVPFPFQPQSEAAAYTHDGRGYLLGSELQGALYRVDCAP
jgi:hypothetical protein